MKRKLLYLTVFFSVLLSMSSCDLETSGNGKLDGFWHLERVDTLLTGGVCDMSELRVFWAFQHHLLELNGYVTCLCRFSHSDGSLVISSPYRYDREQGDEPLTDVELLLPYGINNLEERFTVERLSSSQLVLTTEQLRLIFTKF